MDIRSIFRADLQAADMGLADGDLAADTGLATAVILSLFTDRMARPDDRLPDDDDGDFRGWWGNALPLVVDGRAPDFELGSRLWLLGREKQTREVLLRAREYAAEALAWLTDLAIADRVEIETWIVAPGVLGLAGAIHRPRLETVEFRWGYAWEAEEARVMEI